MEDEIVQRILDGEFEQARQGILEMEDRIRQEASVYNRRMLVERVRRLKEAYNNHNVVAMCEIPSRERVMLKERNVDVSVSKDKAVVRDVDGQTIQLRECGEVVIENCANTTFEHFVSRGSIFLIGVRRCKISCSGQQVRMNGCRDVELTVHTSTGVFLQESTGIVVRQYGDREDNRFRNVCDFSSPFENSNFSIM